MKALVLVDIQNDFLPAGALPVSQGDQVVPIANRVQTAFALTLATQDWHPPDHASFAANHPGKQPGDVIELSGIEQILWPVHCVQETLGAEFAPGLETARVAKIFRKGTESDIDSYSGFFDNGRRRATGLDQYLKSHGVREVYLLGLATDYCVKFTALDARRLDFDTYLIQDGCRGVERQAGDVQQALDEMRQAGVHLVSSQQLLAKS